MELAEVPVVIEDRQPAADDVIRLTLRHTEGHALPAWEPGSHIDLVLADGTARQYSLCGEPGDDTWTVMVQREADGRGGSRRIHDEVTIGTTLVVRGPRNHFALRPARVYRFLAGGIGITPILSMTAEAERLGAEWTLTYCGRSRRSMASLRELEERYGDRILVHTDDTDGLFDVDAFLDAPRDGELAYVCGPDGLLNAVLAKGAHWPEHTIRFERFTPEETSPDQNTEFEVELALTGTVLTVPADRSILDVLTEHGVQVLSSCTEGTCGTCETAVLSGPIDHRDSVLDPEEREDGDVMMVCVSRAAGARLVLDL